jgi:hypothetical protein
MGLSSKAATAFFIVMTHHHFTNKPVRAEKQQASVIEKTADACHDCTSAGADFFVSRWTSPVR